MVNTQTGDTQMNASMIEKIRTIAAQIGWEPRISDDAVLLDGSFGVYKVGTGHWCIAQRDGDNWRSADCSREYYKRNRSFSYFSSRTLTGLSGNINSYSGPVVALRALLKSMRGW